MGTWCVRALGIFLAVATVSVTDAIAQATTSVPDNSPATTTITLRSGNGPVGTQDSEISFLLGPDDSPFDHSLVGSDFAAAQSGAGAYVIAPFSSWMASLPADPAAQWIATVPDVSAQLGSTALYAVSFEIPYIGLEGATLDFWFAVDNQLGTGAEQGLFLNGTAIQGTSWPDLQSYGTQNAFSNLNITSLLHAGTNTLFVYGIDLGAPGGLIFSARLTLEPGPWLDLFDGLAGQGGTPLLVGTGTLDPGSPVDLILTQAKPFSASPLVIGLSAINAPFKGGVMVPNPDFIFPLFSDFFGNASFGGLWPNGVPSGYTTYFQWWVQDPAGPKGFAASNAVAGTTP